MHPWVLVLHHLEEEHAHHLRHGAAGGWMARLAGSCHLDAVDAQLSGKVPKHIGLLQGGLVIKRVHDDGLKRGKVGGKQVEKSRRQPTKTGFYTQPCYQPKFIQKGGMWFIMYKSW